ncbi:MAG: hypothetical protein ACK559_27615, partial [bacterium]
AEGDLHPVVGRPGRSEAQHAAGQRTGAFRKLPVVGHQPTQHDQGPVPEVERVGPQAEADQRRPRHRPGEGVVRVSEAHQQGGRADRRDEGHGTQRRIGMRHRH